MRGLRGVLLLLVLVALTVLAGVVVMRENNGFCGDDSFYEPPFTCFEPEDLAPDE